MSKESHRNLWWRWRTTQSSVTVDNWLINEWLRWLLDWICMWHWSQLFGVLINWNRCAFIGQFDGHGGGGGGRGGGGRFEMRLPSGGWPRVTLRAKAVISNAPEGSGYLNRLMIAAITAHWFTESGVVASSSSSSSSWLHSMASIQSGGSNRWLSTNQRSGRRAEGGGGGRASGAIALNALRFSNWLFISV